MQFAIFNRGMTLAWLLACLVLTTGCSLDMRQQPRYDPLEESAFFEDHRSARPLVDNTVARGYVEVDQLLNVAVNEDGSPVETFPIEINRQVLERGRERYEIYCAPCHSRVGNGQGMIVQRGFKPPPSLHLERLREAPVGYYYDVITNGFGVMYSYASRIPPGDRWAIIAYIRVLQFSQNATLDDVPPEARDELQVTEQ